MFFWQAYVPLSHNIAVDNMIIQPVQLIAICSMIVKYYIQWWQTRDFQFNNTW